MTLIVKNIKLEREIPDEGAHIATITDVKDLGSVQTTYGTKDMVLSVLETDQPDREGKPRKAFKRYVKTLHKKATLRKAIRSITGKDPGDEFDLSELIGRKVQIVIEHREIEGSTYANVTAITRVKSTEPPSTPPAVRASVPKNQQPNSGTGAAVPYDIPEPDQQDTIELSTTQLQHGLSS